LEYGREAHGHVLPETVCGDEKLWTLGSREPKRIVTLAGNQ
jgi:hypothetical protein